ncbi:MAG: hypothetical protein ABSE49_01335 [Polyangiaceae bacterium]
MRRSAVLAAAAVAAIGSGVACGGSVETNPSPQGDAAADVIAPVADYGIAVIPDSGRSPADAGTDSGSVEGGTGLPDASTTRDAQTLDVFAPGADYGIPPFGDGGPP